MKPIYAYLMAAWMSVNILILAPKTGWIFTTVMLAICVLAGVYFARAFRRHSGDANEPLLLSLPPPRRWQWHASRRTRTVTKIIPILALLVGTLVSLPTLAQQPPPWGRVPMPTTTPDPEIEITTDLRALPPPPGPLYHVEYQLYSQVRGGAQVLSGLFRGWADCIQAVVILYRIGEIKGTAKERELKLDVGLFALPRPNMTALPVGEKVVQSRFYRFSIPAHGDAPAVTVTCLPR